MFVALTNIIFSSKISNVQALFETNFGGLQPQAAICFYSVILILFACLDLNLKKAYHIQKPLSNEGGVDESEVISMVRMYSKETLLEKINEAIQHMATFYQQEFLNWTGETSNERHLSRERNGKDLLRRNQGEATRQKRFSLKNFCKVKVRCRFSANFHSAMPLGLQPRWQFEPMKPYVGPCGGFYAPPADWVASIPPPRV